MELLEDADALWTRRAGKHVLRVALPHATTSWATGFRRRARGSYGTHKKEARFAPRFLNLG